MAGTYTGEYIVLKAPADGVHSRGDKDRGECPQG